MVSFRAMLILLALLLCTQAAAQAPANSGDPHPGLIERARNSVQAFMQKAPNIVCRRVTTRYSSSSLFGSAGRSWKVSDTVSADVLMEEGRERYANISVNGKPTDKKMGQIGGFTSSGEFATFVKHVFDPATETRFAYVRDEPQLGLPAAVYHLEVALEHSNWRVTENLKPTARQSYDGLVWIALDTGEVLRLEIRPHAEDLPKDNQFLTRNLIIEYTFLPLGDQRFLLPARSDTTVCHRSGKGCQRNVTEFHDYHRYTGESKIIFTDPEKDPPQSREER